MALGEPGDGDRQTDSVVREMAELQLLLIEGLCRHFPAIAPALRLTARHLLEDVTNLTEPIAVKPRRRRR